MKNLFNYITSFPSPIFQQVVLFVEPYLYQPHFRGVFCLWDVGYIPVNHEKYNFI